MYLVSIATAPHRPSATLSQRERAGVGTVSADDDFGQRAGSAFARAVRGHDLHLNVRARRERVVC